MAPDIITTIYHHISNHKIPFLYIHKFFTKKKKKREKLFLKQQYIAGAIIKPYKAVHIHFILLSIHYAYKTGSYMPGSTYQRVKYAFFYFV